MPSSPAAGDSVTIADAGYWDSYPVTVARNGNTIEGQADNLLLDAGGTSVVMIYSGSTWQVVTSLGKKGAQGEQGSISSWTIATSTMTANVFQRIVADTSGGSFTINLPATPSAGQSVQITDGNSWSGNNLTVGRNGSTIEGVADDLTLDASGVTVELIYDGSTWEVTATLGAQGRHQC